MANYSKKSTPRKMPEHRLVKAKLGRERRDA
jgi:hypothetical protein